MGQITSMIQLEQTQLKAIVEQQLMGMVCYVHQRTGQLISFPDPDRFAEFDDQEWVAEIERIKTNPEAYWKVVRMSNQEEFQLMETFANCETAEPLRSQLLTILSQAKPFRYYKEAIDRSGVYRQAWHSFREQGWLNWLERQLPDVT